MTSIAIVKFSLLKVILRSVVPTRTADTIAYMGILMHPFFRTGKFDVQIVQFRQRTNGCYRQVTGLAEVHKLNIVHW